jgi:hypothetical protein
LGSEYCTERCPIKKGGRAFAPLERESNGQSDELLNFVVSFDGVRMPVVGGPESYPSVHVKVFPSQFSGMRYRLWDTRREAAGECEGLGVGNHSFSKGYLKRKYAWESVAVFMSASLKGPGPETTIREDYLYQII